MARVGPTRCQSSSVTRRGAHAGLGSDPAPLRSVGETRSTEAGRRHLARYRHSMNVLGRSIVTVRCCARRSAQASDQPFHGRRMPIAATSCRYLSPGQLFAQGSRGGVASRLELANGLVQGLGIQVRGLLIGQCPTTCGFARRSSLMSLPHRFSPPPSRSYTERTAKMSSSKPATVISSHSRSRQAIALGPWI